MKYACIERRREVYPVRMMCRLLQGLSQWLLRLADPAGEPAITAGPGADAADQTGPCQVQGCLWQSPGACRAGFRRCPCRSP